MTGRRRSPGVTAPSVLALAEASWGAALLLRPRPLLESVARTPVDGRVIAVARVLAARQLLQGLVTARWPTRRILQAGAAVDALHAATMIAAAAGGRGPRRLTVASAATAGGFAAAGLASSLRE